jgi:PAS domain S-box-containing protein
LSPTRLTAGRGENVREITDSGLPDDPVVALFEDARGEIWVGTLSGVAIYRSGRFFPVGSVPYGIVSSITGDRAGNVWISHQEGLIHLLEGRVVERLPWATLGRREPASVLLHEATQGGLWLGFRDGGAAWFAKGRIRASYADVEGLTPGMVRGLYLDRKRALWAATVGGLSRIHDGRVRTMTSRNGLPCDMVHWMMEDDADSVWLYLACGLVHITRAEFDAWASDPERQIRATVFDGSDGVKNLGVEFGYSSVVAKADGKIWFLPFGGVSVIDPKHLAFNQLPPPVHIERIVADGRTYTPVNGLRLPQRIRDLSIDYTALSLVDPEKVRFRIKLEGQDEDWRELINVRHAQYTNLAPRHYRFRVLASNNSGVWNKDGATLEFSIAPAWFQTTWFRWLCLAATAVLLWGLYRLRVRELEARERRFREAVGSMPAMAFVSQADGSRVFVNRRWLEYTGLTAAQALGAGWQGVVHPDDLDRVLEEWRTGTAKGQPLDYECRVRRADGEYRWFHVRAVSLRDTHGNVTKWYGVATDIEDRKRAEEDRQRLRQLELDLAHMNRLNVMGELTASIAHEVNQPLSGVVSNGSACLHWLAGDAPDLEEARQAVRDIVRDGKRAGEVIAHIRALTKRVDSPREKLDVNELIREVIVLVADEAKRNSVTIHGQFADDLSPVAGDRVEVQQVVLNLILNAIEAMSGVSERARDLVITTRNLDPDQIQVTVEDSGKGVDPQSMSKIFDSFYTTKPSGMGMGLSISRSIIRTHDGQLWATARNGPGAMFHFTLPRCGDKVASAAQTGV